MLEPFLEYFRRQGQFDEVFELCYLSAYDAFPANALRDPEAFWARYSRLPHPALSWFKLMCRLSATEMDVYSAASFLWHRGKLKNGRDYMICEYPEPEPVSLEAQDFIERGFQGSTKHILCPYFSAFLRNTASHAASCFALGQSPVAEITTLRKCTAAAHYNLGEGPEPKLEAFVEALETIEDKPVLGATVRFKDYLEKSDLALLDSIRMDSP